MSAKPENPRQEAGRSPHERVEEAKARVARVLPVGERLDSCLKYAERAKGRVLKKKGPGSGSTRVVGQVRVAGCLGVGRSGTPSSGSPSDPSRHCSSRGGCWEQRRRVGCSASRSGSIEEGTGCVVGENQPIPMDGHVNARDHRVSVQSNGRSHRRSRRKEKMRRRDSITANCAS